MDIDRQKKEKIFWDKFAGKYDPFMKRVKPTYDLLIKRIHKYLDSSKDVLEIATGTGIIALEIAQNSKQVYGCDISPEMIKIAVEKLNAAKLHNVEFKVQDAYHLTYKQESFDVVIASNVLHVMLNPEKALSSIYDVLKSNGILIAPTYCHGNSIISKTISFLMTIVGFRAYQKWSINSFRSFLESNKYEIIEFEIIKDKIPLVFAVAKKKDVSVAPGNAI